MECPYFKDFHNTHVYGRILKSKGHHIKVDIKFYITIKANVVVCSINLKAQIGFTKTACIFLLPKMLFYVKE